MTLQHQQAKSPNIIEHQNKNYSRNNNTNRGNKGISSEKENPNESFQNSKLSGGKTCHIGLNNII